MFEFLKRISINNRRDVIFSAIFVAFLVLTVSFYDVANSQFQENGGNQARQFRQATVECPPGLGSLLCKAGQAVLGQAQQFAKSIIHRPKHWGVPDNEPLELVDDYSNQLDGAQPPPPQHFEGGRGRHRHQHGVGRKRERIQCTTIDGLRGVCRPMHACYARHGLSIQYDQIGSGGQCPPRNSLVCCPRRNQLAQTPFDLNDGSQPRFSSLQRVIQPQNGQLQISLTALRDVISQVFGASNGNLPSSIERETDRSNEIERSIVKEGTFLRKHSPSDQHQRFIQLRNGKEVTQLAKTGNDFLAVALRIARNQLQVANNNNNANCKRVVTKADGSTVTIDECDGDGQHQQQPKRKQAQLADIDFSNTPLASRCPGDPPCPSNAARLRFRSIDGSCNNLRHTGWGKANTPYARILPPDYEDGVSEIRKTGVTGQLLPNPRTVSLETVQWGERPDARTTVMLMQWGQFLDHDLTLAATTPMQTPAGTNIDCCNRRFLTDPRSKHPACISILLPDDDPFYSKFEIGCMNLVRSAPSPPIGCKLRAREQLNQLTHFIDGSMIYGTDQQQASSLRLFRGGLLKSSRINGVEFLPFDGRVGEGCILPVQGINRGMRCFVAGDNRVNELTGLVTIHALMLREHNRVARIIWSLNPDWSDEKIFQETRRIIIAEIQHITYNEFLPLIVGPIIMRDFNLELSTTNAGYSLGYDPETEPSIINEFAGAAYRLHSLVNGAFNFQTEDGQLIQQFKLRNIFNNPASLYRVGNFDGCLNSMINDASQSLDNQFTEELTNHLFQDTNSSFGMDLVSVNIQRGRDHGLPGYNFFRQACGLKKLTSMAELDRVMIAGASQVFGKLYAHVDDIDLFIAGNYEKKLKDAVVGPVFACIIGEQFRRLKVGDRYWFENGNQAGAFSPNQLAEIKRTSLARIICDNSDTIERMQPLAFLRATNEWNQKVPCNQIPWLDLNWWQAGREPPFDPFTFQGNSIEPTGRRASDEDDGNTNSANDEFNDGLD